MPTRGYPPAPLRRLLPALLILGLAAPACDLFLPGAGGEGQPCIDRHCEEGLSCCAGTCRSTPCEDEIVHLDGGEDGADAGDAGSDPGSDPGDQGGNVGGSCGCGASSPALLASPILLMLLLARRGRRGSRLS